MFPPEIATCTKPYREEYFGFQELQVAQPSQRGGHEERGMNEEVRGAGHAEPCVTHSGVCISGKIALLAA